MRISIGLELNNEGRALAWALDFPGCFAYGADGPEAVIGLARQLAIYEEWINQHAGPGTFSLGDYDLRIVDTWEVYTINHEYELADVGYAVNAWFLYDWKPLDTTEIENGMVLLDWSREDLQSVVSRLSDEQLDRTFVGERWSIRGILEHIANTEWWYLNCLNRTEGEPEQLPEAAFQRLTWVRERLAAELPGILQREQVVGKQGEFWSPRKLLRRLLWHEIDHRQHIEKLLMEGT